MLDAELQRLAALYERLRLQLLDISRKNRMLNYGLGARSKRHLQIVDEVLDSAYAKLATDETSLRLMALPPPADIPADERTDEFLAALRQGESTDIEYLTKLEALEAQGRDDEHELAILDRELRNKVRKQQGLPPRPTTADINRAEHARAIGIEPNVALPETASKPSHANLELQTLKFPNELESIVEKIADEARLAEQEMGISTLFLAFGFLEWYDSPTSDKKAFAPLLLLPVRLRTEKARGQHTYHLTATDSAVETNLSLQKLLQADFNRALPDFDPDDEQPAPIERYLAAVRGAIEGLERWKVHRWLVLGHFAFGRFAMYADLNPEGWLEHPVEHPLVSAILRGTETTDDNAALPSIPADYEIDEPDIERIAPLLIHDADASQHSALIDVMQRKNLVIQGPPGTGKSQTITNIIANAMAAGKTVLFLAEKQAALDVVKRRLTAADLGDFCLELHSDRSSPKLVVESLRLRAAIPESAAKKAVGSDVAWYESRREIKAYLDALHEELPDGQTPFQCVWKALRGRTRNDDVMNAFRTTTLPEALLADAEKRDIMLSNLEIYASTATAFGASFGHPAASPWADVTVGNLTARDIPNLVEMLGRLVSLGSEIGDFLDQEGNLGLATIDDVVRLVEADGVLGEPEAPELLAQVAALDIGQLVRFLASKGEWHRATLALNGRPDLSAHDAATLAVAPALLDTGLPAHLTTKTPAELYEFAETTIADDEVALEMIERMQPSLRLFDMRDQVPASALLPLAVAIRAGATVPARSRPWLNAHRHIEPAAFWRLNERWKSLTNGEAQWRKHLVVYGSMPWPTPEELEAAATTLRGTGLVAKALATVNGSAKTAQALLESLGMRPSVAAARDLDALAQHVRALIDFEQNDAIAEKLLGASWSGLSTPFNEIGEGIKLRELLAAHIGSLDHGMDIVDRLLRLEPRLFLRLTEDRFVRPAVDFCSLADEIRVRFDARPIAQVVAGCRAEIAVMEELLAFDPARALTALDMPVRDIAEITTLMTERDAMARAIEASPVKDAAAELATTTVDISRAFAAISWIRTVAESNLTQALRDRLMSEDAVAERARMRGAAQRGSELRARYGVLTAQATAEFGLTGLDALTPRALAAQAETLSRRADELADFLTLRRHKAMLIEAGLGPLLARADEIKLAPERLSEVFATLVSDRVALTLFAEPVFARNSGLTLAARRKQFAERDRKKLGNDRALVRRMLLKRKPLPGTYQGPRASWTEMALLNHEFAKQRRHTPVRALIARAGKSIQALKPCIMMSPLSLAKFVGADALRFDLLVIDEASQMKPEDALGGMLRAAQVVVVGDQKQLPPSDFFSRSNDEAADVEFEDIDDESILEGCQKAFREVRRLKWHYRSRCESLIRFSNDTFYKDGPLITFPAAKPGSFSIDLVRVEGIYQARRNVIEARAIAEAAAQFMRHFSDLDEARIPTLGLVAVNAPQSELIHEELNRLCAGDARIEAYRDKVAHKGEMLFVKNLENVQGDERDFILISLTYGRIPGVSALRQAFGPINGKQGHRRLNVLFTRARMRIGVFASFGSADVTPTAQSSEGVHVLKRYLAYAEGRGVAPAESIGVEADSDFENEVADRLRARGYEVELQVGVSGYRIDLGIRHPDDSERFLAGIECDGARYHASKSARDRDRLREEVLRSLGWSIVRVWSTDWFDNAARETDKLVKALEALRDKPPSEMLAYPALSANVADLPPAVDEPGDEQDEPVADEPLVDEPLVDEPLADDEAVAVAPVAAVAGDVPHDVIEGHPTVGEVDEHALPPDAVVAHAASQDEGIALKGVTLEGAESEGSAQGPALHVTDGEVSDAAMSGAPRLVPDVFETEIPATKVSDTNVEGNTVSVTEVSEPETIEGRLSETGVSDPTLVPANADGAGDSISGDNVSSENVSADSGSTEHVSAEHGSTEHVSTESLLAELAEVIDNAPATAAGSLAPQALAPRGEGWGEGLPTTPQAGDEAETIDDATSDTADAAPLQFGAPYARADLAAQGFAPETSRFFDEDYRDTLRAMVEAVIATEGPVYEDIAVERVARAHDFERIGGRIYTLVTDLIGRTVRRSREDGRAVLWPPGERPADPVPYRPNTPDLRSHADTPVAELAGLAAAIIRPGRDDEAVLDRMADHFGIERLREPTRSRFQRALTIARAALRDGPPADAPPSADDGFSDEPDRAAESVPERMA